MRRKTFDVLFDTSAGMAVLTKQPCLWRSAFYFTLSVGFFTGVTTNCWLLEQELAVRLAIIIAVVIFIIKWIVFIIWHCITLFIFYYSIYILS